MRRLGIPGFGTICLEHLVLDYNGTLAVDGRPLPGVRPRLRALARSLDCSFSRVQFTPDLLPSDVTGGEIYRDGTFEFRQGPVFGNLVLADEINRAPAKVQSALLEAMQERTVTVDGVTHPLPAPFTVFATQNPIEFEGTYPLPEAELDRFLLKVTMSYPPEDVERNILERYVQGFEAEDPESYGLEPATDASGVAALRAAARAVRAAPTNFTN